MVTQNHIPHMMWFGCSPLMKHWQGATARIGMTDIAIAETRDSKVVYSTEHVGVNHYGAWSG
jgi:hypothetical protein